jgi:endonuclease YncB( thermonuclease family)
MRYAAGCITMLAVVLGTAPAAQRNLVGVTFEAHIVSIVDGDTMNVVRAGERTEFRVRLYGVDAPERGEPFYAVATRATRVLLFDQMATLIGQDVDQFGRLVARVAVDGTDASRALLQSGLACHLTEFSSDGDLAAAQERARAEGRGFWATGAQRPRCAFTRSPSAAAPPPQPPRVTAASTELHGNVKSRVYHRSSCRNYTCQNCTRVFQSEAEAKAAGFRPAGDCH